MDSNILSVLVVLSSPWISRSISLLRIFLDSSRIILFDRFAYFSNQASPNHLCELFHLYESLVSRCAEFAFVNGDDVERKSGSCEFRLGESMASADLSARVCATAVDIPRLDRIRLSPSTERLTKYLSRSVEEYSCEEFDFSDVFGPISNPKDESGLDPSFEKNSLPNSSKIPPHFAHREGMLPLNFEVEGMAFWAPRDSISDGNPHVIFHRSHSLVGPAVTPRGSVGNRNNLPSNHPSIFCNDQNKVAASEESNSGDASVAKESCDPVNEEDGRVSVDDNSETSSDGSFARVSPIESSQLNETCIPFQKDNVENCKRIGPSDFECLRVVGQGAFGKVFQVQEKSTGEIFAMKVMRKDRIVEKNHGDYMKAEREILTKVYHPFIVQLQYSFQTESKLYLILDFINGGHLFFQLYRQGTFSEELARIYASELILAVEHLHSLDIIHRDLKPENILLDCDGHVKLTDFGLAKEMLDSANSNSMCGTMEYMAPEIILAKGHGKAADWWSIGILLYEMLTGQPPYTHNNRQKLQQKIAKEKFKLPSYLSSDAHSLLKGLLQKDPKLRLGSNEGAGDIKKHKWFKSIHWEKLKAKQLQPSFRPDVKGKECTANFDEMWTNLPVQDSPAGTPKDYDHALFRGYTYVAPNVWLPTLDSDSQGEEEAEEKERGDFFQ